MEPLLLLLGLAFAANKVVSVVKSLTSGDFNTPVTQLLVWAAAIGGLFLAANADVTEHLIVPGVSDQTLGTLGGASLVLLGLIAGSTGSVVYDFKKAIDGSDSAAEPRLLDAHNTP